MFSIDLFQYLTLFVVAATVLLGVCFLVKLFSVTARRKGGAIHAIPLMFIVFMAITCLLMLVVINYNDVSTFLKENLSATVVIYLRQLAELLAVGRIMPGGNGLFILNIVVYAWGLTVFMFCTWTAVMLVQCITHLIYLIVLRWRKSGVGKDIAKTAVVSVRTFDIILNFGKQRQ